MVVRDRKRIGRGISWGVCIEGRDRGCVRGSERGIGDGNKRGWVGQRQWSGGGGGWMTGGGSVVMATHRSATATRNRVEPRPHRTLPADAPRRHASPPRYARPTHPRNACQRLSSSSIVHGFLSAFFFLSFLLFPTISIEKKLVRSSWSRLKPFSPKVQGWV